MDSKEVLEQALRLNQKNGLSSSKACLEVSTSQTES